MPYPVANAHRPLPPVEPNSGAAARDAARPGRSFADLLAEAEAVQDVVRLNLPAAARASARKRNKGRDSLDDA
jgi:hypothetical protein